MLTTFSVRDFKSFRDATLHFSPLTVLIGANASGKSNLLEALQLASWMASGRKLDQLLSALRDRELAVRGALLSLPRAGAKSEFQFRITAPLFWGDDYDESLDEFRFEVGCRVDTEGLRVVHESLHRLSKTLVGTKWKQEPALYAVVGHSRRVGSELLVSYDNFGKGRRPRVGVSNLQPALTQNWHAPRMSDQADHRLSEATGAITAALQQVFFLDPAPRLMRGYAFPEELRLKEDGANLSAVLFHLCENRKKKDVILEFIGELPEREIIDLDFVQTPRGEVMVQAAETFGGVERPIDAAVLSDGTLRVLAVAAAVLSVPEGSTVIVEEVDNGVHPSRAQRLLQNINEVAAKRRLNVVVTTHNPALLDALPTAAIPFVQYCYRDPDDGCSQIVQLDALARYPELIARDRLGALVTKGLLERMATSNGEADAARRKTGLDWVRELKRGAKL